MLAGSPKIPFDSTIVKNNGGIFGTTKSEELAARRYRQYQWQKRKESLARRLIEFILRVLKALVSALQGARIVKKRTVEKVNVE